MELTGKTALVTGAGIRLGQQIAIYLASRGMRVAVHYHQSFQGAQTTLAQMEGGHLRHHLFQADLANLVELQQMLEQTRQRMGSISVLINNAATFYPTPFFSVTETEWNRLFDLNLKAPFFLSQTIGEQMKATGEGKIINIADVAAFWPWTQFLPYCLTKSALVTLTQGLAKALAPEIHVNAIAPGNVLPSPPGSNIDQQAAIEQSLLKRRGSTKDIVNAVDYLLHGDFLTGVVLPVDGGRLVH